LHAHLVYFYAINFMQRGIGFALGLITIDMLNQSLLQGEPLSPWVSSLIGVPEWAQGNLNELSIEQRHELKWTYFYIIIGAFLIQWPLQIINPYYNMWIMQRINQDLRVALLQRWHQLSLSYHSDHRTGDSIYRIYQDSSMVTSVVGQLISLTQVMMSYYTCVALVSLLSPWIALMAGTLVVPALLWAHWAMPRVRTFSLVYRAATSDVTSTIQETFGSIKLIKAFNTTRRAQQRLENDSVIAFNAAYRVRKLIAFVTIVMFTIAASFMISGEFLMAWWASNSESTYATDLIAVVGLSWLVWNLASFTWTRNNFRESANDLRSLLRNWMTAQDMAMGLRRVFDILDIDPEITNRDDAIPMTGFRREIRFENVSFSYEAKRPVLEDVTFAATPGSISALIGPTGSGKSTLMALLLRLFDPAAGSISIDGIDLRNYQIESLRRHIAIALQENVLFGMSVRENIRYVAPEASDAEVSEAVRIADMSEYVSGLPHGLDTVLSDRGGKLSTGQRQRLSIARAVVRDTPILVLDEPTAALDAATEHRVMGNLSEWGSSQGRAIFVITHRISTIRRAENILYLDSGRILESGSHEALMQIENGRYRGFVETESSLQNIQSPS
jgi:ABC-type multidrug transport system fused ATPase/permease subunit